MPDKVALLLEVRERGQALLVDDEDVMREATTDTLIELGYAVVPLRSAEEALALIDDGLDPDLVLTDHLMPGMSGIDLADALRLRGSATAALLVSGYAEDEGVSADLPRLNKPFW